MTKLKQPQALNPQVSWEEETKKIFTKLFNKTYVKISANSRLDKIFTQINLAITQKERKNGTNFSNIKSRGGQGKGNNEEMNGFSHGHDCEDMKIYFIWLLNGKLHKAKISLRILYINREILNFGYL